MSLLLLDCPTGLAGNMLLAALLDLGVPEAVVHGPLADLGLAGRYRLQLETRRSGGLRGLHLAVESLEADPPHRHWGELRQQLGAAPLDPTLKERVIAVFSLLAEAEAAVHGQPVERVHFHEVGALDALVDVVGVCAGLLHLEVERLVCGIPPAGHGAGATAHGLLPLPAPAVLEIARRRGIPLGSSEGFAPGELTTPTGLALVACWADHFGAAPAAVPRRLGVGLGSRSLDRPNLLRLCLAQPLDPAGPAAATSGEEDSAPLPPGGGETHETLLEQQAQIDDASAEDLAFLAEAQPDVICLQECAAAFTGALAPGCLWPAAIAVPDHTVVMPTAATTPLARNVLNLAMPKLRSLGNLSDLSAHKQRRLSNAS